MNKQLDMRFLEEKLDHQVDNNLLLSAIVAGKRALKIKTTSSILYFSIGVNSLNLQNYSKAEKLLKRAIMMHPNFSDAHYSLGICFLRQKDYNQASKAFKQAIDLDPTLLQAYNVYGAALFYMGDIHKATEQFEKVLEKKPQDSDANNNIGFFFLIQQRYEEAIKRFRTAITSNQDEPSTFEWLNCAMVFWHQDKKEEALEIFKKELSMIGKPEKQEVIESYKCTLLALERKALQRIGQEEKIGIEKAIAGIKWILELLENIK